MFQADYLGLIAGALTTCSVIPQLMRVFKLKSAREVSLLFTTMMLAGIIIWIIYGVFFELVPVVLWNVIASVLVALLIYAKLRYGRESKSG